MSKKKKKKKVTGYEPFGNILSVDTTFVQAAVLIDKVGMVAYETNNTELMMQVATSWLQLGAIMHGALESEKPEGPEESDDNGAAILGFGNTATREKAEAENRGRKS